MYCQCDLDWTDGTNACQQCGLIREGILPEKRFLVEGKDLNGYSAECHEANKKWWLDLSRPCSYCEKGIVPSQPMTKVCSICNGDGFAKLPARNIPEMLCLVHSEISEALEGHRKNLQDDKLPHRKMFEVELADALIRIFDIGGGLGLDLEGAYKEKMAYNAIRADHKIENRTAAGGKAY